MKELVTEIDIAAPPSRVWRILTDFEKHADWNPFMTKVRGRAVEGEKIEVTLPNPQGGTMVISPTIFRVEDEKELRWLGKTEGDTFNGEHSFTGSMVPMLEGWLDSAVRKYFEDMNKALKNRAESK
jgi:hypothetical protein